MNEVLPWITIIWKYELKKTITTFFVIYQKIWSQPDLLLRLELVWIGALIVRTGLNRTFPNQTGTVPNMMEIIIEAYLVFKLPWLKATLRPVSTLTKLRQNHINDEATSKWNRSHKSLPNKVFLSASQQPCSISDLIGDFYLSQSWARIKHMHHATIFENDRTHLKDLIQKSNKLYVIHRE